jgi:hypothetical protein
MEEMLCVFIGTENFGDFTQKIVLPASRERDDKINPQLKISFV